MIRVTIAEAAAQPAILTDPQAPVWHDAEGTAYRVASGLQGHCPPEAWQPDPEGLLDPPQATAGAAIIIAGMDGRAALRAIGLHQSDPQGIEL
ncbi:MAG: hypothetical protein JJU08_18460 [Rhodobacteraceae bacterium]|nr:hypothetical protein [Paracoccaceae bacterium]